MVDGLAQVALLGSPARVVDRNGTLEGPRIEFEPDNDRGRVIGAVVWTDLLSAEPGSARPLHVGGRATPWGVYLHSGLARGGVGDLSLLASGAILGLLFAVSYGLVGAAAYGLQRLAG